jgi:hypothetical protein
MLYSFDLGDFEKGEFTATRFPDNVAVSGDWVCRAESDEQAIAFAKRASEEEWTSPETRGHDDFTVEFVDSRQIQA